MFPRIYGTIPCPLDGYAAYSVRLLMNPTRAEQDAWYDALNNPAPGMAVVGAAAVAIYGETRTAGLDFATTDASRATLDNPELPNELLGWLFRLPGAVWAARMDDMKKKLASPLMIGTSSPDSSAARTPTTSPI